MVPKKSHGRNKLINNIFDFQDVSNVLYLHKYNWLFFWMKNNENAFSFKIYLWTWTVCKMMLATQVAQNSLCVPFICFLSTPSWNIGLHTISFSDCNFFLFYFQWKCGPLDAMQYITAEDHRAAYKHPWPRKVRTQGNKINKLTFSQFAHLTVI